MEVESIKARLRRILQRTDFNTSCQLFLFGSALRKSNYLDIDILIIYTQYDDLLTVRNILEAAFEQCLIHITCLTVSEELELSFINRTGALKID